MPLAILQVHSWDSDHTVWADPQDQDVDVKFNFQKGLILKQYWPLQYSKLTIKN